MKRNQFLDFTLLSKCMTLCNVPYKTLVQISYVKNSNVVCFKLSFTAAVSQNVSIFKPIKTRQNRTRAFLEGTPSPAVQPAPNSLPEDKVIHIRSLSNHFSAVDLEFWRTIIENF